MASEARSGNPAKKAAAAKKKAASSASDFKKRKAGQFLALPSGLTVRAKRVELQTFILQGNVPNPLMEIVSEALEKGNQTDLKRMVGDAEGKVDIEAVREMYGMVDSVVMACVIEPKVHPLPTRDDLSVWNEEHPDEIYLDPDDLRSDDRVYIDEVEDEDKMFLFQWSSGGTEDVARFREEARADMATLAEIQGAGAAAQ